jgi:hypothetical protein
MDASMIHLRTSASFGYCSFKCCSLQLQTNKLEYLGGETGRGEAMADLAVSLAKSVVEGGD